MKTNRRLIHLITPLLFVLSILATAGIALAGPPVSSGSSYEIFRAVEAGAGASSSAGYQLLGLAGEPSSLDSVSSASYSLRPGYRLAAGAGAGTPPTLTAFSPVTNTIAAPLDSSVVLTYSAAMDAATVTSRTVVVHSMMQGLVTGTHSVNGNIVTVDPNRSFFPGELVYAVATTQTTNINGTQPLSATQWQFAAAAGAGPATFDAVSNTFGPSSDVTSIVALGDVDGDGDLDAAVGNFGEQNVVYLNNGDGSFAASGNTFGPGNDRTNSLALGDVDGDGDLDAAVGNFGGQNVVYLNNGDGSFAASGNTFGPSSDATSSVALGDVDGDGDLDAAVGNYYGQNVVYLNNGDGSFAASGNTFGPSSDVTSIVALGDVDGDGDLDAAVGNNDSGQNVVYLNNGDGSFAASGNTFGPGNDNTTSVALGDVDGDGDLDLAVGNQDGQNVAYLNNGDGTFAATGNNFGTGSDFTFGIALGDVDGDGDLDAAVGNDGWQNVVYLNNGDGSFAATGNNFGTGSDFTFGIALGDVDGDGDLDAAVGNSGQNAVWLNEPDVTLSKTVTPTSAKPGDSITYTLTFSNAGGQTATGVAITDSVPVSVTNVSVSSSGAVITQTGSTPNFVWVVEDLSLNEGGVITISGVLSSPLAAGVFIINTATITTSSNSDATNNSSSAGLTVQNAAPVAVDDPNESTSEDVTLTISPLGNDSDPNGDTLSISAVSNPVHGTASISGSTQVVYTPPLNYSGTDVFTYTASDNTSLTDTATVTVTVNPVNDAPQIFDENPTLVTHWGSGGTKESQFISLYGVEVDSQGNVYVPDHWNDRIEKFDSDGNFISAWGWGVATGSNSYEICTSNCQAGISGSGNGQFDDPYFLAIDSQDQVYVANYSSDRIQKFSSDGTYLAQWSSFGSGDSFDGPYVIAIDTQDNVYVGDYDNYRVVKFDSSGAYLTEWDATDSDNGDFYEIYGIEVDCDGNVYVYDYGYYNVQKFDSSGNFLLSWDASDSANGEFSDVNDIVADCQGNVYVPDYDYDNIQKFDSSGAYLAQWPVAGSPVGMTAIDSNGYFYVADYYGDRILKYGLGDTAVTMSEDGSPTAFDLTLTAFDAEGDTLTWSIATQPISGTATASGAGITKTIGYTPPTDWHGTTVFTVAVSDGVLDDTVAISVTVESVNDAPTAVDDPSESTSEDTPLTISPLSNDSDIDGDSLTISAVGAPQHGTTNCQLSIVNCQSSMVYTPTLNYSGTDVFTYTASDGSLTDTATISITVSPVNDAPAAANATDSIDEDSTATGTLVVTDADSGDTFTYTISSQPLYGAATINQSGGWVYTPTNRTASYSVTLTALVADSGGLTGSAVISVAVTANNDSLLTANDSGATAEDTAISQTLTITDSDSNDSYSYVVSGGPSYGTASVDSSGTWVYTPTNRTADYSDVFTVTVTDGGSNSDTATVTIAVTANNVAPVLANTTRSVAEDAPNNGTVGLPLAATDADGDTLSYSITGGNSSGLFGIGSSSGQLTVADNSGLDYESTTQYVLTVAATDGSLTGTATITVSVTNINDSRPVLADASRSVAEDAANGDNVGAALSATDADGDTLSYSITGGNSSGLFGIGGSSGQLTVADNSGLDYETTTQYVLTIAATDGSLTDTASVTVSVTNTNDNSPVLADASRSVAEDAANGDNVGAALAATDADGDTLSYSISAGNTGNVFGIGSSSGQLTVADNSSLDYESVTQYVLTVAATDGSLTGTATITVSVTNINDSRPVLADASRSVAEGAANGDAIGAALSATDADGDSLSYSISAGNTGNVFGIGSSSGQLSVANNLSLDYETTPQYILTVAATDGLFTATASVTVTVTDVAEAITAVDDAVSTAEDAPVTIFALSNDLDPGGQGLTITAVGAPQHGATNCQLSMANCQSSITYTPDPDFHGTDVFTYTAASGQLRDTATVTVTVNSANDRPVAVDDSLSSAEDVPLTFSPLPNDSDPDGDSLSIVSAGPATLGVVTIVDTQTLRYTPPANYSGPDSLVYTISDEQGQTASAKVSLDVTAVNDAPDAVADSATTNEDQSVTIDLLLNDSDVESDTLTISSLDPAHHGTVSDNGDGTVTYTPAPNYHGSDSFAYSLSDGQGGVDKAPVDVTVTPVNDAPQANDDSAVSPDGSAITIDLLGNDSDADGDSLSISSVSQGSQGSAANNGNGTATYTPNAGASGLDSFSYQISDGNGGTATATVQVIIQPQAGLVTAVDDHGTTYEERPLAIDVLANDQSSSGASLSLISVTAPQHGTATYGSNGQVIYSPAVNFHGIDQFSYAVGDGGSGYATAAISVTVLPVNDPPDAVDDSDATNEDTVVTLDVLANDSDPDGDSLAIVAASQPAHGTVVLSGTQLLYRPQAGYAGADNFSYTLGDGQGGLDTAAVNLTVTAVNDPPDAVADTATTAEDTPVSINVLFNDTDPEGDPLNVSAVTQGQYGTVTNNNDGTVVYRPGKDYNGQDAFTYSINDGVMTDTATVRVTITPVEDDPTPVQDAVSTPQDTPVRLNPADNDLDAEGRSLCPAQVGQPAHGAVVLNPDCSVVYTPQSGYSGTDHFTYTLQSGVTGSGLSVFASVKIGLTTIFVNVPQTVNAGADTPTTAEDTPVVIAALSNDSGGGGTLSLVGVSQPAHGTVIISGTNLIYTPDLDYSGSDSFDYTASDGGGYGIGNVSVTVTPVNDAPNARDDSATTNEEQAVTIDLLGNDSDRDNNNNSSSGLTISDVTYGQHGAVDDNLDGTVTYTPEADYYGSDSFAYTIDDGSGSSDRAVVEVTVSNTNDDPVANQDIVQTNEDVAVIISPLRNDWDVDADSLSLSGNSSPAHGTATLSGNGDGTVTYTPDPDFFGSDSFTCTVDDGQGGSGVATVWLTVSPVNDAPQANDDSASLSGGAATVDVLANDSDVDGDQLVVTAIGPTGQGTVVNHGDGTVTYSAGAGFNGSDVFTYTVEDAHGATATAQVDIGGQAGGEGSTLYLPLLMRQQSSGPDLVIDSLSATENGVTLVIRNQGNAPVDDAFWVDVYFDPNQPPTVNQPWPDLAAAGLVWGVTQSLSPGESLTLTSGGAYFDAVRSSSPPFAVGATVYAYVDSVDFSSSHGAVQESSEDNNRFGPETVTAGGSAAASEWSGGPVDWDRLPGR